MGGSSDAEAFTGEEKGKWTPSYLAFVLVKGGCERPISVDLGPAEPIEAAVAHYRSLVEAKSTTLRIDKAASRIRELVWDPITPILGDRRWVWVIPDAALNGVAFNALPSAEGYLIEKYTFSYLGSGMDLLRLARKASAAMLAGAEGEGRTGPGMTEQGVAGFNPMVLSGIVLAGANKRENVGSGDDGILTAEEAAGIDLGGTELVVLSACETGLGEVKSGEGVMGLRRAFTMAGAKALVMSLWTVPDQDPRLLMEDFYKGFLGKAATDKATALRSAQLKLLKAKRASGDPEPRSWSGFIVSGK